MKIAIFPDHFAHYRVHGFTEISRIPEINLTIFVPQNQSPGRNVKIAQVDHTDTLSTRLTYRFFVGPYALWTKGILRAVRSRNFDLVVCWGEVHNISTWFALIVGRFTGRKILLWTHGLYGNEGFCKRFLRSYFYGLSSGVLLYGHKAKSLLESTGLSRDKLFVIYNSLDYQKQRVIREGLSEEEVKRFRADLWGENANILRVLICVGRLVETRKLELALSALRILNEEDQYRLLIVGDGPMLDRYREISDSLGVKHLVRFEPATYSEESIGRYLMSADLAVCPGLIGLFAVHAHAYGLPVCTSDPAASQHGPEVEIIIEGETGLFFCDENGESLSRTIDRWFQQSPPPDVVKTKCIAAVESSYTPAFQARVFKDALDFVFEARR